MSPQKAFLKTVKPFACPNCGKEDINHIEDIPVLRTVIGQKDEYVIVEGLIKDKCYEEGSGGRLECGNCGEEVPIPEGMKIEYV